MEEKRALATDLAKLVLEIEGEIAGRKAAEAKITELAGQVKQRDAVMAESKFERDAMGKEFAKEVAKQTAAKVSSAHASISRSLRMKHNTYKYIQ